MGTKEMAVVSKMYCSSSEVVLCVRTRPHVVGGGGFVVTNSGHQVVFRVDGCGVLGKKDHITLNDAYQTPLLLIRRKGGIVEALSLHKQWRGYTSDYENLVFTLKDPQSCLVANSRTSVRVSVDKNKYFHIKGYFPDRDCSIVDSRGNIIAQVGVNKEMKQEVMDVYDVVIKAGIDQAFVVGVIAVLDYIHNGSTTC